MSFDVTSLFTKVPIAEALELIGRQLEEQEAEERNTTLCSLNQETATPVPDIHILMWSNRFYQQKEGAAIGNPLSPVVANIYMEHFEALAIESARLKPATWLCNVDDTFVVWNEGRDKLQDFLEHLNTIRPSIQFTMELKEDGKLPFLDVLVTRGAERLTKVYRKAIHTDRYIHFTSNHHNRVKQEVIKCLKWRATRICETEDLEAEEDHLRVTFRKNGYPETFIAGAMMPRTRQEAPQGDETVKEASNPRRKTLCILPYIKGTSDKIADKYNLCSNRRLH